MVNRMSISLNTRWFRDTFFKVCIIKFYQGFHKRLNHYSHVCGETSSEDPSSMTTWKNISFAPKIEDSPVYEMVQKSNRLSSIPRNSVEYKL